MNNFNRNIRGRRVNTRINRVARRARVTRRRVNRLGRTLRRTNRIVRRVLGVARRIRRGRRRVLMPPRKILPPRGFRPINNQGMGTGLTLSRALRLNRRLLVNYIRAILDPEFALASGTLVKQASHLPIPSTSISFKNEYNITPEESGEFYLFWAPNYFSTKPAIQQYSIYGKPCNFISHIIKVTGSTGEHGYTFPSYLPDISMSKYRLVSAKIKITYIGAAIDTAGKMYGCATYESIPVLYGSTTYGMEEQIITDGNGNALNLQNKDQYKSLFNLANIAKIRNGLWAKSVDVKVTNNGVEAIYLPTDPTDHTFYPMTNYYSTQAETINGQTSTDHYSLSAELASNDGAHLSYAFAGSGLPLNQKCINVQTFYNFEIIPTAESAPIMRNNSSEEVPGQVVERIYQNISSIPQNQLIRPANSRSNLAKKVIPLV